MGVHTSDYIVSIFGDLFVAIDHPAGDVHTGNSAGQEDHFYGREDGSESRGRGVECGFGDDASSDNQPTVEVIWKITSESKV